MYYLIKKNQKKLMAIFAVLLMISFVATIGVGRAGSGFSRSDVVVGHMGKSAIYDSEFRNSREEWAWLSRWQFRSVLGQPMKLPARLIADGITGGQGRAPMMLQFSAEMIGNQAVEEIDRHPEAFLLLKREALADGMQVTPDEAKSFLKNSMGMTISNDGSNDLEVNAIQDMMLISQELGHLKSAIKVSQPLWEHDAVETQSVRLGILDFRASDYEKGIAAPTTQQVQQQFDRFKDVPPHESTASNPLGFGYQIPARVKLQYVEIPRAEVIEAVIRTIQPAGSADLALGSSDPKYNWEVQAASYYNAHPDEFKNAPQTRPATRQVQTVTTQPTTEEADSQPTVKPFNEVKQEILDKLAAAQADTLQKQIADDLSAKLASDFQLIRQADPAAVIPSTQPATQSTTIATSQPTTNLMMLAHLEQIRDQIQQKYHVAVGLHDLGSDWQSQADLAKLPGIGSATGPGDLKFPEAATAFARPTSASASEALQLWQPSPVLSDAQQNGYLFRLTAAQPPHAPADMGAIAKQVESDWKLSQAYDQAMQAAQKAYASAKSNGISQAARTAGMQVITTPLFPPSRTQDVPGYPLDNAAATQALLKAASDLLTQATPSDKQPDALVPLPSALRVAVVELEAVQLPAPQWMLQFQVTQTQQMEQVERLARDWFNYDLIVARTGYKAEQKS